MGVDKGACKKKRFFEDHKCDVFFLGKKPKYTLPIF